MVFGYHRYNIWRHQRQKGKPFKSRKVIFSPKVNNNQIQKNWYGTGALQILIIIIIIIILRKLSTPKLLLQSYV